MVDLACSLANILFFDIPLLYCYTNLNPSIICCYSSKDMYLFFGNSISLIASFFECSLTEDFETLVILSVILLPIKSLVASTVF